MISVLFVCLGNICRSPIAEAVFRQLVEEKGLSNQLLCDSAGTHGYHVGELPDARTRRNAEEHGLTLTHRCRRLSGEDFSHFQYIIGMDATNLKAIHAAAQRAERGSFESIFLFRQFDPKASQDPIPAVPDPYYEGDEAFEEVYQLVRRCSAQLIHFLTEKHTLGFEAQVISH